MASVVLDTSAIQDFDTFHKECAVVFGFPSFYGCNMNAWIDCLTYLPLGDGMTSFELGSDEQLFVHVTGFTEFSKRAPDVSAALLECTAFVNRRYIGVGDSPRLALVLQ